MGFPKMYFDPLKNEALNHLWAKINVVLVKKPGGSRFGISEKILDQKYIFLMGEILLGRISETIR
jgi:hypothetical protein